MKMKGAIVNCLAELVKEKFGKDTWERVLEYSDLNKHASFMIIQDVEDEKVLKVIDSVCKVCNITFTQAADAFGEYWVNTYAPRLYSAYYSGAYSSKDFLLKMDSIHQRVTTNIKNAHPPRFDYSWVNDKTLIMTYKSSRNLIDLFIPLVKAVGTYFKENLQVAKLSNDKVQIIFP